MKNVKLFLCLVLAMIMMAFSACGSGDEKDAEVITSAAPEDTADEAGDDTDLYDDADNSAYMYGTVQEYAESDIVQDAIESMKETYSSSGLDVTVTGEDNKLIYNFTYLEVTNYEGLAEALESGLESTADTYKNVASSIKLVVDEENPIVVVRYVDANGEEIYSKEFSAE